MANPVKGEVRRLADAFPMQEAERASKLVEDSLQTHRNQLHLLEGFLKDNRDLSKLVQSLPQKISHNVMVPFGKVAFFPGRLVHTNEFLVLLGENYYAECSAKQTVDILDRRGEFLESKIAGIKAQISDFKAESLFFSDTLAEAAAGVVEIREEYVEPSHSDISQSSYLGHPHAEVSNIENGFNEQTSSQMAAEDKEHERIMARLNELELAEAAAKAHDKSDEGDHDSFTLSSDSEEMLESDMPASLELLPFSARGNKEDKIREETKTGARDMLCNYKRKESDEALENESAVYSSLLSQEGKTKLGATRSIRNNRPVSKCSQGNPNVNESFATFGKSLKTEHLEEGPAIKSPGDLLKFEEWRRQRFEKECALQSAQAGRKDVMSSAEISVRPQARGGKIFTAEPTTGNKEDIPRSQGPFRAQKAFTGTVVEHSDPTSYANNAPKELKQVQTRPASRFKMRQAGQ